MAKSARGPLDRFLSFIVRNWFLLMIGMALTLGISILMYLTDIQRDTDLLESIFFLPFGVYAIAIAWVYLSKEKKRTLTSKYEERWAKARENEAIYIILFFAILIRAILVPTAPTLSDDVYRFHWDGKMAANGINPYQYAPNDVEIERYRDANWERINNKDVSSPYPPFSQMVFLVGYLLSPTVQSIYVYKALFTMFDILAVVVLFGLLRGFRMDPRLSIIYAWSPLAAVEFAHAGHNDSLAIFFMLFSFMALRRGNRMTSAACLALGALTKIFPLILAPIMFRAWGKKGTALFIGVMGLFYLPYISAGRSVFSGISAYTDRWLFNGSVFPTALRFVLESGIADGIEQAMFYTKFIVGIPFILALGYLVYRSRKDWRDAKQLVLYAFIILGLFLLLTSTVEPWYVLWVVPFLCVFLSPAWVLFSGSVFMSYYIYIRYDTANIWEEPMWLRLLEYVPFFSLLAFEIFYWLGRRTERADGERKARPSGMVEEE